MTLDLEKLEGMCEYLYNVHPQLRISQLRFLLHIQLNPNKSLSEIAIALGQTLPAISRAIDVFGETKKARTRDLSLGFVTTQRNPMDDRVITVKMTPKGEHFINQMQLNYDHLEKQI